MSRPRRRLTARTEVALQACKLLEERLDGHYGGHHVHHRGQGVGIGRKAPGRLDGRLQCMVAHRRLWHMWAGLGVDERKRPLSPVKQAQVVAGARQQRPQRCSLEASMKGRSAASGCALKGRLYYRRPRTISGSSLVG